MFIQARTRTRETVFMNTERHGFKTRSDRFKPMKSKVSVMVCLIQYTNPEFKDKQAFSRSLHKERLWWNDLVIVMLV